MNFNLTAEQSLMCLCMRHHQFLEHDEIKIKYDVIDDGALFAECERNRVQMIVGHALIQVFGEKNIPEHWVEAYTSTSNVISKYMTELDKVATLLKQQDIAMIALKNSGITRGLYGAWGSCPMGDLDVLVDSRRFEEAHKALLGAGYKLKFRSQYEEDSYEAALAGGGAEYSVLLDTGEHLWFELQWRPIAGRWIQESQEPKASDLLGRSKSISGTDVRLLSPEDNLIQVCLHTAKHSFVRAPGFRLHTDVDRIVAVEQLDWGVFVMRVNDLKVKTPTYLSLIMAAKLIGTPIPEHVLDELAPNSLKVKIILSWIERVGVFYPDDKKWGRLSFVVFVALLFDTPAQLVEGLFPTTTRLKRKYGFQSTFLTPYFFGRYVFELLLKRVET